jgi:hypothetical protein
MRDRPLIGTMHFCVSEQERRAFDSADAQVRGMVDAQRRFLATYQSVYNPIPDWAIGKTRVRWPLAQWQRV